MSFINQSVNYSETENFKSKFLKPVCENITSVIRNLKLHKSNFYKDRTDTGEPENEVYIPNNNKKYYLFIIKKRLVSSNCDQNCNWNFMYFFPDEKTLEYYKNDKIQMNNLSDFFIETDTIFPNINSCLFEGYLYNIGGENREFLITDILYINSVNKSNYVDSSSNYVDSSSNDVYSSTDSILKLDYTSRFMLINELFLTNKNKNNNNQYSINSNLNHFSIKNINNNINLGIHQFFSKSKQKMISIFKKNFIYKQEICSIETVSKINFKKVSYIEPNDKTQEKWIEKNNKFPDVYNVYDYKTMNSNGILYVKGIKESKHLKSLFTDDSKHKITCKWNSNFNKWQPLLN